MALLEIKDLEVNYGVIKAIKGVSFDVNEGEIIALIGANGAGKAFILYTITGMIQAKKGSIVFDGKELTKTPPHKIVSMGMAHVPEGRRIFQQLSVLENLKLGAYTRKDKSEIASTLKMVYERFPRLEERKNQVAGTLSGGEQQMLAMGRALMSKPRIILMDEPTNHLDVSGREKLYEMIRSGRSTLLIVSHDRTLLNLLPCICELEKSEVTLYGGNYEFYKEQKELALTALQNQLSEKEKELRLARKTAREVMERKNKSNVRSDKSSFKKGISRMAVNTLKDKAEKSTVRLNDVHEEKMASLQSSIASLQDVIPDLRALQTNFNSSDLHTGKILITADQINFGYTSSCLWKSPLNIQVRSGDRIHITGNNGSGKTTLVKLLLGELKPAAGTITRADFSYLYIDQECSVLDPGLTVFEQTERFNASHLAEHELKSILNRCLFPYETWDKPCFCLSGGEKIRLLFCCLMIGNNAPDVFILDEPTNNLDIQSVEIITAAIKSYRGTVLLISHDHYFVKEIKINRSINLFDTGSVIKI